jgi:hypothetical protein
MVLVFYLLFAGVATYPFVLNPLHTLTAPNWGDVAASVSKYEAFREGHGNPFVATHIPWIGYPQGPTNNTGVDRVSFVLTAYLWLASELLGAITAHSLLAYLGYVLTAFITFLFVRRVTASVPAGLIAGFAYGFCPQTYTLARADMAYIQMWLFILVLWAFWELATAPFSRRRFVLAALSILPAVFWTPYYMFHTLIVGATCVAVASYWLRKRYGWRLAAAVAGLMALWWGLVLLIYRYIGLHSPSSIVPDRTMAEIYSESAQPLMYLLPGQFSWGPHGESLLVALVPRAKGLSLYLGLSVVVLAATALVVRARQPRKHLKAREFGVRVALSMAGLAGMACFIFSLPPTYHLFGLKIPMPGYLVAIAVPALRAGQRLAMPLMGCVAVLAGVGAYYLLQRLQPRFRNLATIGILIIIGVDLWALPPESAISVPSFSSLAKLRSAPSAPAAQFDESTLVNYRVPCMYLQQHRQQLVNDCGLERNPDLARTEDLPLCVQIPALEAIGTRYAIVSLRSVHRAADHPLLECLKRLNETSVLARDSSYEVVLLRRMSQRQKAQTKTRLALP